MGSLTSTQTTAMKIRNACCRSILGGFLILAALLASSWLAIAQAQSRAIPAQRLIIQFDLAKYEAGDADAFEILSQRSLRKVLPPFDQLPSPDDSFAPSTDEQQFSGFWYELVAGDGSVRYRRSVENPILMRFEGINPANPQEGLSLVEALPDQRVFSLLLPYLEEVGTSLVIYSSPLQPGSQHEAASEIARLPLAQPNGPTPEPEVLIVTIPED
jgi:hypothetical protein